MVNSGSWVVVFNNQRLSGDRVRYTDAGILAVPEDPANALRPTILHDAGIEMSLEIIDVGCYLVYINPAGIDRRRRWRNGYRFTVL
jgi:hypothetical protein